MPPARVTQRTAPPSWRSRAPGTAQRPIIGGLRPGGGGPEKGEMNVPDRKNQCIHCSVESCRHLKEEQGVCSLESIQVAPTPMAYSGDPADESMCQSYETK